MASNSEANAKELAPVLEELRSQGVTSLRAVAEALNERGMLTRRGGRWWVPNVRNLHRLIYVSAHQAVGNVNLANGASDEKRQLQLATQARRPAT